MTELTLVYLTNRKDPKFEWFFSSLSRELEGKDDIDIQLVIVDYLYQFDIMDRVNYFGPNWLNKKAQQVTEIELIAPKPTVWQGKHRLTQKDYFAASNARNTGIAYAKNPYVVFCDDLSILMPGWLNNVVHAAQNGYVVCGAYRKVYEMQITDGLLTYFRDHPGGHDSRTPHGSTGGIVPCGAGFLFGCSFGAPLESLLQVNGLEERCDSQGGEDYDLGFRLERLGQKLFYNLNMMTYEAEELHHPEGYSFTRTIEPMTDGRIDSSHIMLNSVRNENRVLPLGPQSDLRELRELVKAGVPLPIRHEPSTYWPNNKPLSSM